MLIPALAEAVAANEQRPDFCGTVRAVPIGLDLPASSTERLRLRDDMVRLWPLAAVRLPADGVHVLHGLDAGGAAPDFTGRRVALVAHWSADGTVNTCVRQQLAALQTLGYAPVLASASALAMDNALAGLCAAIICRTVPGYDFTSWKAAFAALPTLWQAREVVLTNDSVFGPVGSLAEVHEVMAHVACDFWGLVESREKRPHLQSYYLVLKVSALAHPAFAAFMEAVDCSPNKLETVLRYEVTLAPWLALHGLQAGVLVPAASLPRGNFNPAHYLWRVLIERFGMPFIKRDLLREHAQHPLLQGWEACLARKGYDPEWVRQTLV